jgi:hypothetical protein
MRACLGVLAITTSYSAPDWAASGLRQPYRREVVEAVQVAREQGVKVIGISDSPASPIIRGANHGFVVAADTPQFFPNSGLLSTESICDKLHRPKDLTRHGKHATMWRDTRLVCF